MCFMFVVVLLQRSFLFVVVLLQRKALNFLHRLDITTTCLPLLYVEFIFLRSYST